MSDLNTYAKNAIIASAGVAPVQTNTPGQYATRKRQWYDPETRKFTQQMARYSSDFVEAQVQGLDQNAPTAWGTYRMRFADVVHPTSAIQRNFDDYKQFLFESPRIEYVPIGAKIVTMGSTWLVTNPANISGASGSGIARRCNSVWNHLDFFGNVISEPIIVENTRANANDDDAQQSQLITKGYFNVLCQYNEDTAQIDTNTRMILGSAAYRVTGFSDFTQEFTGDYGSVRMLAFTIRYEEPNDAIDDMENHVAGGKSFTWNISLSGVRQILSGQKTQFSADSTRNGLPVEASSGATYIWSSDDENIATVDENGVVTAKNIGAVNITATLAQNTNYSATTSIQTEGGEIGVFFNSTVPSTIDAYSSVTISAAFYDLGEETDNPLDWSFTGEPGAFAYTVAQDKKSITLSCYGYSESPIVVKASYTNEFDTYTATAEIYTRGI